MKIGDEAEEFLKRHMDQEAVEGERVCFIDGCELMALFGFCNASEPEVRWMCGLHAMAWADEVANIIRTQFRDAITTRLMQAMGLDPDDRQP